MKRKRTFARRSRGSSRPPDRESRVEQAVRGALETIAKGTRLGGGRPVTMVRIAKEACVGRASLYRIAWLPQELKKLRTIAADGAESPVGTASQAKRDALGRAKDLAKEVAFWRARADTLAQQLQQVSLHLHAVLGNELLGQQPPRAGLHLVADEPVEK